MSTFVRISFLEKRRAGILLHPTSLPGAQFKGDLGPNAYQFVDWMTQSGLSVWQMLPLNPTAASGSPYQCQSSFAGNTELISVDQLITDGFLPSEIKNNQVNTPTRLTAFLGQSSDYFQHNANVYLKEKFDEFCSAQAHWLEDWALYSALKEKHQQACWTHWPSGLKNRDTQLISAQKIELQAAISLEKYAQFLFFLQWNNLKNYANSKNILLFGDVPIFVSHDSSDVWAEPTLFQLDADGKPITVAGVPPDYFSETGQRWGNPHYNWARMQQDNFQWWRQRIKTALDLFDLVRIDHFRGLQAYWEIPAQEETAVNGHWQLAPGEALLSCLAEAIPSLSIVAEDLGIITDKVVALRDQFDLPGMKILEFAFSGEASNPYLPHNHIKNSVVYTGTHDNNTLIGWINSLDEKTLANVCEYLNCEEPELAWNMIRAALMSVADLAIFPLQDFLMLDEQHRMNTPGTLNDENWKWRFNWEQIPDVLCTKIIRLIRLYDRG